MKKTNLYLLFCLFLSPILLSAQATEYVTDGKTQTVMPANTHSTPQPIVQPIKENLPIQTNNPQPAKKPTEVTTKAVAETTLEEEGLANMQFEKKKIDFGTVKMGDKPSYIYYFTNVGKEPIVIDIVSACDCTDVEYSQTPIQVGEKGFIKATFITERAVEYLNKEAVKDITIILKNKYPENGYPMVESLYFRAFITE